MSNITHKELRIGNFVLHDAKPYQVVGISINGEDIYISEIGAIGCAMVEEYQGIPITKTSLKQLGWQYLQGCTDGDLTKDAFNARLEIDYDEKGIKIKSRYLGFDEYRYLDHIKFIHQLQNLYFFLEGVELEVKS